MWSFSIKFRRSLTESWQDLSKVLIARYGVPNVSVSVNAWHLLFTLLNLIQLPGEQPIQSVAARIMEATRVAYSQADLGTALANTHS